VGRKSFVGSGLFWALLLLLVLLLAVLVWGMVAEPDYVPQPVEKVVPSASLGL
jgi:hypothetical protein